MNPLSNLPTPDLTKADVVAVVQGSIAVAVAFGLNLTMAQQGALIGLAGFVGAALVWADTQRRAHRLSYLAAAGGGRAAGGAVALPDLHELAVAVASELAGGRTTTPERIAAAVDAGHAADAAAAAANGPPQRPGTYPDPLAEPPVDTATPPSWTP